jgi:branched-chain amino acid transport system substrate-binding protein
MPPLFSFFRTHRLAKYGLIVAITLLVIGLLTGVIRLFSRIDANAIHVAIVAPLTSDRHEAAKEMVQSVQLYFKTVNKSGGIHGKPLKLSIYDDQNLPNTARNLPSEIAKSSSLVVLGHLTSATSIAAAQGYKTEKIPVITGTASADVLTQANPYYFRTTFTNSQQGKLLALYAQEVLKFNKASVIYADDIYGNSLQQGFHTMFKGDRAIQNSWNFYSKTNELPATVDKIVDALANDPDPGIVFLAMDDVLAKEFIVEIRRRELDVPLLGNDTFARETYPALFDKYDEEKNQPGYFIDGINAAVPIIFDSADVYAQEFASAYQQAYGKQPTYVGASYYNSAKVAVKAIRNAEIRNTPRDYARDRQRIQAQLQTINTPEKAVSGLMGPIYFNRKNDSIHPIRFGKFVGRSIVSALTQLNVVSNLQLVDLDRELQSGNIVVLEDEQKQYFWKQDVIYTGIDINKIGNINQSQSSFTADFYFWLRYSGTSDALAIEFPSGIANSVNQNLLLFNPNTPLKSETIDGLNYRLYHIRGEFKGSYDFRDYPFDRQKLKIYFQNTRIPSDRLIYVVDTFGLKPKTDPKEAQKPYQSLQLWKFEGIQHAQETFSSTSTRGNPRLFNSNIQVDYPGLSTTITVQRRFTIFLIKTLLPLALLVLVLYSTLYFSENLVKERLTVAISALLSSAVLLTAINAQLADTGYTVAIEYGFYIFFGLCLFCIFIGIMMERLRRAGRTKTFEQLNCFARIFYAIVVFGTIATYATLFGSRL